MQTKEKKSSRGMKSSRGIRMAQLLVTLGLAALLSAFVAAVAPTEASAQSTPGPNRCIVRGVDGNAEVKLAHWGSSAAVGYTVRQNGRFMESGNIAAQAPRGQFFSPINNQPTRPGRYHYSIAYSNRSGMSAFTYCGSIVVPNFSFPTPACSLSKAGGKVQFNLPGTELRLTSPTYFRGDYVQLRVNGQLRVSDEGGSALYSALPVDRVGSSSIQHGSYRYWDADRNRFSEWRYCGSVRF